MDVGTSRDVRLAVAEQGLGDFHIFKSPVHPRTQTVPERVEPESFPFLDDSRRGSCWFQIAAIDHLAATRLLLAPLYWLPYS
jgi:hypothetical protein